MPYDLAKVNNMRICIELKSELISSLIWPSDFSKWDEVCRKEWKVTWTPVTSSAKWENWRFSLHFLNSLHFLKLRFYIVNQLTVQKNSRSRIKLSCALCHERVKNIRIFFFFFWEEVDWICWFLSIIRRDFSEAGLIWQVWHKVCRGQASGAAFCYLLCLPSVIIIKKQGVTTLRFRRWDIFAKKIFRARHFNGNWWTM